MQCGRLNDQWCPFAWFASVLGEAKRRRAERGKEKKEQAKYVIFVALVNLKVKTAR